MKPRRGRPKKHELLVSSVQRAELERIARQSRSARSVAFRARIVLECAGGTSNAAVAAKLRTTGFTVGLWRNRFIVEGIAGLGTAQVKQHWSPSSREGLESVDIDHFPKRPSGIAFAIAA
jgi:Helix-turn-helix domain